ncbi:nuclear transport factor 2 family protein [Actinoplanes sp. NPDC051343]|uniref:nuclear transport factor 2 family protein n=1 Tax=Actinoplanes sp. NPDC051343 TaxID=3363906 RepID=UPI0037A3A976
MAQPHFRTPGDDLTGYLRRYPHEVAFGDEEPAVVFSRYHTDDFVLRNDGIDLGRERLLAHVRSGRRNVDEIHVEVHQTLTSAGRVAGRYTLTAVMRRGQVIATEIYMFGELAPDGRLHRVEQLSRDVSPKEPAR